MRKVLAVLALVAVGCGGMRAEAANERGRALSKAHRYREAMNEYAEAVRLNPDDTKYRYNLGLALARHGMYDQSIAELQEVLRREPGDMGARRTLANVQARSRNQQAELVADELRH